MGNQIFLFSALLQEFYVTTQAFLLLMHSQSYLLCIARYPSYMNVHFQQLHRTTAEIIFRYGNISFRTTAEIIFRHGNISFFLFLVKKPLKQTNKQTKKKKTNLDLAAKYLATVWHFWQSASVFIVKFLPKVPSCYSKATWSQSLQTDLALTPLCMSYPTTPSPYDRLPFGTQIP